MSKKSRTSHTANWIFSLLIITSLSLSGCGAFTTHKVKKSFASQERVFFGKYDQVWRASQLALANYPIKMNNMDLGVIETEFVKGDQIWTPPHNDKKSSAGVRYNLALRVIAGKSTKKNATKVSIFKKIEKHRDFFSKTVNLPSDGLEERALLYRISRELKIEKALQRYQEQSNQ